jgi:general secretion pathway protein A
MFLQHFALREQPFGVTPDPRFLYFSPTHREALASIYCGLEAERGFVGLVASPGAGKTTLLFQLLERLNGSASTAFVFQTQCGSLELLRYIAADLGLDVSTSDPVSLHAQLNAFLSARAREGRRVIVVIDEAQNLDDEVLETARLLSDFETPSRKLLQIVLAGQPELARRLEQSRLVQLRQRMAVMARLDPLSPAEVSRYIDHRLRVSGSCGADLFTPGALEIVARRSAGIPRDINSLCFQALSLACALQRRQVDIDVMTEVVGDPFWSPARRESPPLEVRAAAPPTAARPARTAKWLRGRWLAVGLAILAAGVPILWNLLNVVRSHAGTVQTPRVAAPVAAPAPALPARRAPAASGTTYAPTVATAGPVQDLLGSGDDVQAFIHIVEPGESLGRLSVRHRQRFDQSWVANVQALNPDISDPNHIEIGQTIRLPPDPPSGPGPDEGLPSTTRVAP